ncbi:MAG: hypothetical protein J2P34_08055, partial [Actinobacteria bacterium]|nr:hypothetical protein [Actinomycetota bacterium]
MSPGARSGEPGRLRRWLAGRTLRGRLIAGLLGLLAVAFAAIGILTSVVLTNTLINQVDAQLAAAGTRYSSCVEHNQDIKDQPGVGSGHGGPPAPGPQPEDCNNSIPGQAAGTFGARVKHGAVTAEGIVGRKSIHLSAVDRAALLTLQPDRQ